MHVRLFLSVFWQRSKIDYRALAFPLPLPLPFLSFTMLPICSSFVASPFGWD